jgi:NADH-quinone oxidoreductase subunit I
MGYWSEMLEGGWSLVQGMRVTVRRLVQPVVTVQYPRKHLQPSPAYRGHTELKRFAETETHACIACGTCQRRCPSGVIKVQGVKSHAKSSKVATHYLIDYTRCSLCGLCVECCPTQTLKFSTQFALEGVSRWDGVIDLIERLEENKS